MCMYSIYIYPYIFISSPATSWALIHPKPILPEPWETASFWGMSTWFLGVRSAYGTMDHTPTFHKRVIHRRLTYSSHIVSWGSYVSLRGSTLHTVYIDLLTCSIFMSLISAFLFLPNQRWKINLNNLICFSIFIFERPNKSEWFHHHGIAHFPLFFPLPLNPGSILAVGFVKLGLRWVC